MQLHQIISAMYVEPAPSTKMSMMVEATLDSVTGKEIFHFAYSPADPHGLNPDITAWLVSHPEFNITPYDPNKEY